MDRSTAIDQTLVTAHSVTITGLAPNTTYNWRVRSKDAAGNETVSANSTFTTAAALRHDRADGDLVRSRRQFYPRWAQ